MPIKITNEIFIKRAEKIHNKKYSYKKSKYIKAKSKIIITCSIHGDFKQTPDAHLRMKEGCPKCGVKKASAKCTKDINYFIKKAKSVHGERFCYNKVKYQSAKQKVIITCKIHGDFKQAPSNHYAGKACPKCSKLNVGWKKTFWTNNLKENQIFKCYIIKCYNKNESFFKVGITKNSVKARFPASAMPYNYKIIKIYKSKKGEDIWNLEAAFKKLNENNKYLPLISFGGKTECFTTLIFPHHTHDNN